MNIDPGLCECERLLFLTEETEEPRNELVDNVLVAAWRGASVLEEHLLRKSSSRNGARIPCQQPPFQLVGRSSIGVMV